MRVSVTIYPNSKLASFASMMSSIFLMLAVVLAITIAGIPIAILFFFTAGYLDRLAEEINENKKFDLWVKEQEKNHIDLLVAQSLECAVEIYNLHPCVKTLAYIQGLNPQAAEFIQNALESKKMENNHTNEEIKSEKNSPFQVDDIICNQYRLLEKLDSEPNKVCFRCQHIRSGELYTIACIEKKQTNMIENSQEYDLLKECNHQAIPKYMEYLQDDEYEYHIIQSIEGENLKRMMEKNGTFNEREVTHIASQVTDVLDYLHTQNPPIIHRDIKPAGIVSDYGSVKLIDFGIARKYDPNLSSDEQILGTRGYAPPEQYGTAQTDGRSDIYALGITMLELLTGLRYIEDNALFHQCSPMMQNIILKCIESKPENRYQTAVECKKALQEFNHSL